MTISITLKHGLQPEQEQWLAKNVGPRMHYTHQSIGGQGWIVKKNYKPGMVSVYWILSFEDERYATYFSLMFPQ
jgi:hypothetical protein